MALDKDGNVYVAGSTNSTDFVVSQNAFDNIIRGVDGFIVKLDTNLSIDGSPSTKIVTYQPVTDTKAPESPKIESAKKDESVLRPIIAVSLFSKPLANKTINFGAIKNGGSKKMTVTISNKGTKELSIGKISGDKPIRNPFILLSDNCSNKTFAPKKECHLTINYLPGAVGAKTSEFDIPSNDPTGTLIVKLTGKSIQTSPSTSSSSSSLEVLDTAKPYNDRKIPFGIVAANIPVEHTVTLKNKGKKDIEIGQVGKKNGIKEPFSIMTETCSGISLKPTNSCTITIRFISSEKGTFTGVFDIPLTGTGEKEIIINLSGIVGGSGS
ncbi:MAG: choice-of-anchor D domain-containing protein [Nitrospirae bacterium]|nr:choice-of-anchor D domain-containing protein [Nitrospirota bacterium]